MAIQLSDLVRNGRLDAIETVIGATAKMGIRSGAQPANCAAADAGDLIATLTLPADWMDAAASGDKDLLGSWTVAAGFAFTAGHFRIYANDGTTCGMQGSITATGGGGDLTLDDITIEVAQTITVTAFTLTDGNP